MSIHKLTAGSGYDYLTRQVAVLDATDKGHTGLAAYYSQRGEQPGVWVGAGLAGIAGVSAGDPVTAEQMQALFGQGLHPLAAQNRERLAGPDLAEADYRAVTRLGAPFKVYSPDVSPYRREVAARIAAVNTAAGLPGDWPVPLAERARARSEVAREFFHREHGRFPADARELAGAVAELSRPRTTAVAGYDLTFSPVKSVSTLWAVGDPAVSADIEQAHQAAVADALRFLETHALFSREGTNGVRQVNVRGLVATAFTHRDSRAGDPDLHTHVAVANKVQTLQGRWLAVDGRVLFKATVAASETYNTALEHHLTTRLGVRFAERPNPDPRKRPVREIVGVDPALTSRWSARRHAIEVRQGELAAVFQSDHGRPPTPVEAVQLAQQATLETRDRKHQPRSLAEQRASWRRQALDVLGGPRQLQAMITATLRQPSPAPARVEAAGVEGAWVERTAHAVVTTLEGQRATWQVWHVRAEAHRRLRAADLHGHRSEILVDQIVRQALLHHSVPVGGPDEELREPAELRRGDGASVYTVAGSHLYTSCRVLAAEQRLVATAGRDDGHHLDPAVVDQAIAAAAAADGIVLDAGQAALVKGLATSGRRLQLAIAPAGAGKTTALAVLSRAWTADGGQVIGLAPSAAAAAQLRDHTGAPTDTLAKLTWALDHGTPLPGWAAGIGPTTLVLIDEAGMADTLTLDSTVAFVTGRGGSVRLVGDDQQLAAIGAGGILRDLAASHGAIRLTELHRFTDLAEAAASLALRDGHPEALGFYLDQHRIHVGDTATMTEQVFAGWQADQASGLDPVMLAPTRELVADLNSRARSHRLHGVERPAREVVLADGNRASVGDLVLTRSNDRRLRVTASDWVKNGDRWTVLHLPAGGGLTVQHVRSRRTVTLPRDYVQTSVELGYATTVHTAQGVTADTMHGLADWRESRQQLYTMLTRGRAANHLYLPVVGDGDPHSVIRPDSSHPSTATDLLEQILRRDTAAESASTLRRQYADPAVRLGDACDRYRDALQVAAEHLAGPATVTALTQTADTLMPGLPDEPAWPTLRGHLLLHAAAGADPTQLLTAAVDQRELDGAHDRAAVLDGRIDDRPLRTPGPLPWLPGMPDRLATHPHWRGYLTRRATLIGHLTDQVRAHSQTADRLPEWADQQPHRCAAQLVADIEVWRAASHVDPDDLRPTGPTAPDRAGRAWQHHLHTQLDTSSPAAQEWTPLLTRLHPALANDPFTTTLAGRLAALTRTGVPAAHLLQQAAAAGPLPDHHAAAALWWRLTRHLHDSRDATCGDRPVEGWAQQLHEHLGPDRAAALERSPWWPALAAVIHRGLSRGWALPDLLPTHPLATGQPGEDEALTLLRRAAILTTPTPTDDDPTAANRPEDLPDDRDADRTDQPIRKSVQPAAPPAAVQPPTTDADLRYLYADLAVAAMVRNSMGPLPPTDADHERDYHRALAWDNSPVGRDRLLEVNELACQYYQTQLPGSWGQTYLTERLRTDLTGHPDYRPGQAPAGWAALTTHLRRHGVTDLELLTAGLASRARTGRLIDRFRDRVILPILRDRQVLGFVGRRHPQRTDTDHAGPKYLNTPDTPLFHKGAQLYGALDTPLHNGAIPVLVEGPLDAIAVTLATNNQDVGLAPLGTALTSEQADQLGHYPAHPVVGTDNDPAGRAAAERAYWLLTPHRLDPRLASLPTGADPAEILARHGAAALTKALEDAHPLADALVHERLTHPQDTPLTADVARIIAARPAPTWQPACTTAAATAPLSVVDLTRHLLAAARTWNTDPRDTAQQALRTLHQTPVQRPAPAAVRPQRHPALRIGPARTPAGPDGSQAFARVSSRDPQHQVDRDLTRPSVIPSPPQPPSPGGTAPSRSGRRSVQPERPRPSPER